ncbi:DUF1932 domain-containing protein [Psychrobacillus sp. NPDC096389]|uniref:DUF1932 domain-containing protein n=1 Tax=Psychrobacillus sp. NPDC096389 TaxID=3364490 RepID=UPI00381BAB5A
MTKLGFIGFGEAAASICSGLKNVANVDVFSYDIVLTMESHRERTLALMREQHVNPCDTLAELINNTDIIFCLTSAKFAIGIAQDVATIANKPVTYIDLNSASPGLKKEIAKVFEYTAVQFLDGAVMESVPPNKHRVPILLSGANAHETAVILTNCQMKTSAISEHVGDASSIKITRSIFVKGFTGLLIETLQAASKMNILPHITDSINQTFKNFDLEQLAEKYIPRTAIHANRRAFEMQEAMMMMEELSIRNDLSKATKEKLEYIASKELDVIYQHEVPASFQVVIQKLNEINEEDLEDEKV